MAGSAAAPLRVVHRLSDLDRRGRGLALVFALALSLPPVLAFTWALPDWAPSGDAALMGIRALDVGTTRTPLVGLPSTAGLYVGSEHSVHHLGPTHLYLLAGAIRVFGSDLGMLLVSVLIAEASVLLSAWAVYRQLGSMGGILAAVLLGMVMFTTGASSLVDPVSSRVAGYPLLCSAFLCWSVLSGDMRLLPLTTAVVSFTAQQHLSVAPAVVVLTAGAVVGVFVALVQRREVVRWCAWSASVALLLWAPVLLEQVISPDGNLGRVLRFAGRGDRNTLGARSALQQIANSIGLPPLLGRTEVAGGMIVADASTFTRLSAGAVLVIVAALGLRWRTGNPRQATLAVMVAVLVLAGFVNGSSVPVGMLEESRISFYHWSFALAACTWLVLGLGVLDLLRPQLAGRTTFAPALTALALAAIILPAALNPWLDRESNRYSNASGNLRRRYVHQLADAVLAHRSELGAQTVLLSTGGQVFAGYPQALAYELTARGIDLRHPPIFAGSVHDDRLVKRATVGSGLVLIADTSQTEASAPQGTLLAKVGLTTPDVRAFDALVAQAKSSDQVELGPAVQEGLSAIANPHARLALTFALPEITRSPRRLLTAGMLRLLRDHPIEKPRLDPELIDRVLATVPPDWAPDTATDLRLYLVSRENLKI